MKTIEVFATDNAGSVGNKVFFTFNYDPATHLEFAATGEPPATALPGANFASPLPVVVDAEDEFGNIATTYNGPVTISLDNNATGLGGTLTMDAVAGVATFSNLMIANDGTYHLLAGSPGLVSTNPPSTSIYIVGVAASLYIFTAPPGSVQAGADFGFEVGADDIFGNPTTIFPAKQRSPWRPTLAAQPEWGRRDRDRNRRHRNLQRSYTQQGRTGLHAQSHERHPYSRDNGWHQRHERSGRPSRDHAGEEPPSTVTAGQTFAMAVTALDPFGNIDFGFCGTVTVSLAGGTLTAAGQSMSQRHGHVRQSRNRHRR